VLFNHQCPEHVELLDPERARPLLCLVLGELHEQPRGLQEVVGLPVKLDGLQDLLLVQEVLGCQTTLNDIVNVR